MSEHGKSWELSSKADVTNSWALQGVTFEQLSSSYKSFLAFPICACRGFNDVVIPPRVDGIHWQSWLSGGTSKP